MKELVTVIVPVYNVEQYVEKCLISIRNQTYHNLEIIVVDDGATDNSGKICDRISEQDKRISVIHKKNGGLSSARNIGMKCAKGEYLVFVDGDDWIGDTMIEKLVASAKRNTADLVCCGKTIVDENMVLLKEEHVTIEQIITPEEAVKSALFNREVGVAVWAKLFRRTLWKDIWFPEGEIHEDVAVIFHILAKCRKVSVINQAEYYYRYNPKGISKQQYSAKYNVVLKHEINNETFLKEKFPALTSRAKAATARSCLDMMIKIVQTPAGYEQYGKEFQQYRNYLRGRSIYYLIYGNINWKRFVWLLFVRLSSEEAVPFYKKAGLFK